MEKSDNTFAFLRRKAKASSATRWSRKELAQIALLKGAHQESIAPLLRDCPVRVLANGEVLLRAGEPCQTLFMVLSGRLRLEDPIPNSPDTFIRAGDCVGELLLLENTVFAPTISAVEPTRLLLADRDVAWALIRGSHDIARNWLSLFAERTRVSGVVAGAEELKTSHPLHTTHDERTGLFNRRWLDALLPRQMARSNAGHQPLALLLVEIDGFAEYIARFGQITGDLAYQAAAQTIILSVRPTDQVVSYGTAQFAVVLPDSDAAGACLVGERMRGAIAKAGAIAPDENVLHSLTISVGATEFKAFTDASTFLAGAETALQMARSSGGDRVAIQ
jgi:diguanylate cyclase (GGDEF)-like protein